MEETISLQDILKVIRKRLLLIIIFTVTGIGVSAGFTFYMTTPMYMAQTQILVNDNTKYDDYYYYSLSQINTDLQLISTYNDIIISPVTMSKVIEELELDMEHNQLANKITLSSDNESKVFKVKVVDPSYDQAVSIANTVAEVFKEEIPALMNVNNINILAKAEMNENPYPVSPNKNTNLAIGFVIGLMLGLGLAFLLEFLDTTIKDEKVIVDVLNIPVMGIVGSIPSEKNKKSFLKSQKVRGHQSAWIEK